MTAQDKVRRFILDELQFDRLPAELTDDFPLLAKGVLDSLGVSRLVTFLEAELGVPVEDEDLVADNFASIASIARLVARKKSG